MIKLLKTYVPVVFGFGLSRGCIFIANMLIARQLGVKDFGVFSVFYVVMLVSWQIFQPFDRTFVRYSSAIENTRDKLEFLRSAFFCKLVLSLLLLLIAFPLSNFVANIIFRKPEIAPFLVFSFLNTVGLGFLSFLSSTYQAEHRYFIFSIFNALYSVSILLVCLFFILFGLEFTIIRMLFIYFVVIGLVGIACLVTLVKRFGLRLPRDMKILEKSINLSKWILGILIAFFVFRRIDIFVVTKFLGFREVGLYSMAAQLVMLITFFASAVTAVFLPKASNALKTLETYKAFNREVLLVSSLINVGTIAVFLIAPLVVRTVFGNEFSIAAKICRILLVGNFFVIYYIPLSFLFFTLEAAHIRFYIEGSMLVITAIVLAVVTPRFGVMGTAITMTVILLAYSLFSTIIVRSKVAKYFGGRTASNPVTIDEISLC